MPMKGSHAEAPKGEMTRRLYDVLGEAPVSLDVLCARLGVKTGKERCTVVGALRSMVRNGYVVRTEDAEARRYLYRRAERWGRTAAALRRRIPEPFREPITRRSRG